MPGTMRSAYTYSYGTDGDANGMERSLHYPSGNRVNYSYNAAGRITAIRP